MAASCRARFEAMCSSIWDIRSWREDFWGGVRVGERPISFPVVWSW